MNKNERRGTLLSVGVIVLLLGVLAIYDGITKALTWNTVGTKILEVVGGSFIAVIGTWCCAWGVSDEAGENASKFLKSVWNRFLEALHR